MAWELWHDNGGFDSSYGHIGYFCNTGMGSLGPVLVVDSGFHKGQFYELWGKANLIDPRRMDEGELFTVTKRLANFIDYSSEVKAAFKVFINDKVVFEQEITSVYENCTLSPFHAELEGMDGDVFATLDYVIDDLNNDLSHEMLTRDEGSISRWDKTGDTRIDVTVDYTIIEE